MQQEKVNILIVDDSPEDLEFIQDTLMSTDANQFDIATCSSAKEAIYKIRYQNFHCILIDYNMPGHDGFWVLNEIQMASIQIPVVMLTGGGDERVATKALKMGAQDYLSKNSLTAKELHESINYSIRRKQEDLAFLARATRDTLTGVMARYAFLDQLENAIARAERTSKSLALIFVDLNKFKEINDTHGHDVGDQVIKEAASRMYDAIRRCDSIGRYGGDEFVILLEDVEGCGGNNSWRVASRLAKAIKDAPYCSPNLNLALGASIGIALYPLSGMTGDELIRAADEAMYECKNNPSLSYSFHSQSALAQHHSSA